VVRLCVDGVTKRFGGERGLWELLRGVEPAPTVAVDDVSFGVETGEILGIAGESGAGKSTVAKLLAGLLEPSAGELVVEGETTGAGPTGVDRQMVFQDPYDSLNPRFSVRELVAEPLAIARPPSSVTDRGPLIEATLETVGLGPPDAYLDQFPRALSGGERQRVAIARAVICDPELLIADEPVSMLDTSVQAGILDVLDTLRTDRGLGCVFVSHDLSTLGTLCDRIAVMRDGKLLELQPTDVILRNPSHEHTRELLDAVPGRELLSEKR